MAAKPVLAGFAPPRFLVCKVSHVRKHHLFYHNALLHVGPQVLIIGADGVGLSRHSRSKVPRNLVIRRGPMIIRAIRQIIFTTEDAPCVHRIVVDGLLLPQAASSSFFVCVCLLSLCSASRARSP